MRIGIIGCGFIAQTHAGALKRLGLGGDLHFYDTNRVQAERLVASCGSGAVHEDLETLFSNRALDCTHILTPLPSHFQLAEKALVSGCHVYIEKPVTQTAEEFKALCELARSRGKVLCAGYSTLGMPVISRARKEVSSGRLGRLISVHCDFLCSWPGNVIPYGDPSHWAYGLKGGVIQNMVDHPLSLVVDSMDEINDVSCSFSRRNKLPNDCFDLLSVTMKNDDQVGSFTLYLGSGPAQWQVHYFLEEGMIMADMGRQLINITRTKGPQNFVKKTLSGLETGFGYIKGTFSNIVQVATGDLQRNPGVQNTLAGFYQAVSGRGSLIVSNTKAQDITRVLDKVWESMDSSCA